MVKNDGLARVRHSSDTSSSPWMCGREEDDVEAMEQVAAARTLMHKGWREACTRGMCFALDVGGQFMHTWMASC